MDIASATNSVAQASALVNGDGRLERPAEGSTEAQGAYKARGPGLEAGLAHSLWPELALRAASEGFLASGGRIAPPEAEAGPGPCPGLEADGDGPWGVVGSPYLGYLDSTAKSSPPIGLGSETIYINPRPGRQFDFTEICPGWAAIGVCENGHRWAKELVCGKEWCPECGQDDSIVHRRRMARWLPKVQQLGSMGYLVITFPESMRWQLQLKPHLGYAYGALVGVVAGRKTGRGREGAYFSRGLARWHWFGEENPGKFHPHVNILVEGGYLGCRRLRALRRDLARAVRARELVVNYQFTREPGKMAHWLRYVTRATFLEKSWAPDFADVTLYNFRNARWWGSWKGEPVWGQDQVQGQARDGEDLVAVAALENGECPECGKPLDWARPVRSAWLKALKAEPVGAGYYRLRVGHGHDP